MKNRSYIKKRTAVLAISFLSAAALALAVLCGVHYERAQQYELYMSNNCQHAFDELVTAVGELDSALQKSVYATSPEMAGAVCTEIFGKAMTAQMSLGVLPFATQELERTSGFISRVGDYAFALSRNAAGGQSYTEEQLENLRSLSETAEILSQNLKAMQTDILQGVLTMDKLQGAQNTMNALEDAAMPATVGDSMRLIEQEFPEVPSLIYDGPFSEHIAQGEHKALSGLEQIEKNEARELAARFTGISRTKLYPAGECEGEMPCYYFAADLEEGTVVVAVTKQGGKIMSMLSSRSVASAKLSAEEAMKKAESFLTSRGFKNMSRTYYMIQGNILTANFAYEQDEVICYSDLVKVAVALDTGAVCGFEAKGYLSSHYERELPRVAVTKEAAQEKVSTLLQVENHRLALIPSEGMYETLCHEFTCRADEEHQYIVYVDAVSGAQKKILILLQDENGALTL